MINPYTLPYMKKFLFSLAIAIMAITAGMTAKAYSPEMAQVATALNTAMVGDDIKGVSYDGSNLVIEFRPGIIAGDEAEMFEQVENPNDLKGMILAEAFSGTANEEIHMLGTLLEAYNTNMKLSFPLPSGKMFSVTLTPSDLKK